MSQKKVLSTMTADPADPLAAILHSLPALSAHHARGSAHYRRLAKDARTAVEALFSSDAEIPHPFGDFGTIILPYCKMGQIDSLDLFGLDELILFAFYWTNRGRYHRVLDLGANVGLHSILLARCGFDVSAFEPDPETYAVLSRNLALNDCRTVRTTQAAVAAQNGTREFVRVLGNRTGSHLAGTKPTPYGALEAFSVKTVALRDILGDVDFIKMDVEGAEAELVATTTSADWDRADMLMEIGNPATAHAIYEKLSSMRVNIFAQRLGWARVRKPEEMPSSYKDGSAFISRKDAMPWSE